MSDHILSLFFFFKQKTAYEMRISDWSSDVCSSDLAGFESGHAYGKSLRTVKSCVGSTWCRYGVQDSATLAIDLENRYKGLRSPHKIKFAVSGCTRECAEAQGKDRKSTRLNSSH